MRTNIVLATLRIMYQRGSPERILYSRKLMIVCLLLALAVSGLARVLYFGDHIPFAILWVFAKTTMFMLWVVLLTAKVARLRLATMMLSLVLISLVVDSVYILLSPLPLGELANPIAWIWGASALYGMGSVVAWARRQSLLQGLTQAGGYLAVFMGLDLAFRHLYSIMAAG